MTEEPNPIEEQEPLNETDQPFRAELDSYSGPLDLLLYLIKRDEVDVFDIPVAQITEEYLRVVSTLELLDMNIAGEFLVMAATLMEIKSRMLLPMRDEEEEGEGGEEEDDPRNDLIRQLLQYKAFKEAAQEMGEMAARHQKRTSRPFQPFDSEPEPVDTEQLLEGVQIWDLLAAFSTLMEQTQRDQPRRIVYDDVPMSAYRTEVRTRLAHAGGQLQFFSFFSPGDDRRQVISIFLALLDLVRRHELRVRQLGTEFSDIVLELIPHEEREAFLQQMEEEERARLEQEDEVTDSREERAGEAGEVMDADEEGESMPPEAE